MVKEIPIFILDIEVSLEKINLIWFLIYLHDLLQKLDLLQYIVLLSEIFYNFYKILITLTINIDI